MDYHRNTARGILFLLVVLGLAAAAVTARAGNQPPRRAKVPAGPIVFPVIGTATYTNDFGDSRPGGRHQGNDIMAPKRSLAVAAEPGKIEFWTTSSNAGCMLYLYGDSGTTYLYIHLNNDLTAGNDNRGKCVAGVSYAPGLKEGDHVEAGQPVGFVGDSGDANGIASHLHFEVHPKDGAAVNPFPYLNRAQRLLFAAAPGSMFTLVLDGTVRSTQDGLLQIDVSLLRQWPSHTKVTKLAKPLTVTVPIDAQVERQAGGPGITTTASLLRAKIGERVRVWTAPAPVTLPAQTGADGALTASRVLLGLTPS
jgi:hypothetical protein